MGRACPTCTTPLLAVRWLACGWCGAAAGALCHPGCTRLLGADGDYAELELRGGDLVEAEPEPAPTDLGLVLEQALAGWEAAG